MAIRKGEKDLGNCVALHEQGQSTSRSSTTAREEDEDAAKIREELDRMAQESSEAVRKIREWWRRLH